MLLLPIIPAYIFYKLLPSSSVVRGPFKGLNINMSGAFSGYFLLVLISSSFLYINNKQKISGYEVWQLSGKVLYTFVDSSTGKKIKDITGIKFGIIPPEYSHASDGKFTMNVLVKPGHVEGLMVLPTVVLSKPNHKEVTINLNSHEIKIFRKKRKLVLKDEILLEPLPQPIKLK